MYATSIYVHDKRQDSSIPETPVFDALTQVFNLNHSNSYWTFSDTNTDLLYQSVDINETIILNKNIRHYISTDLLNK